MDLIFSQRIVATEWCAPNIALQVSAQKPTSMLVFKPTFSKTSKTLDPYQLGAI
jgi:hypothetical protein